MGNDQLRFEVGPIRNGQEDRIVEQRKDDEFGTTVTCYESGIVRINTIKNGDPLKPVGITAYPEHRPNMDGFTEIRTDFETANNFFDTLHAAGDRITFDGNGYSTIRIQSSNFLDIVRSAARVHNLIPEIAADLLEGILQNQPDILSRHPKSRPNAKDVTKATMDKNYNIEIASSGKITAMRSNLLENTSTELVFTNLDEAAKFMAQVTPAEAYSIHPKLNRKTNTVTLDCPIEQALDIAASKGSINPTTSRIIKSILIADERATIGQTAPPDKIAIREPPAGGRPEAGR